ncbi:MAG: hypothetical protein HY288_17380 [Planctomycetia bacterium]|nr:hypothetical protein [Planctomycetia bacterium]
MRLTLRTMLAYLDDIPLEPEDREDIGRKIEESEFATNLVHRTRDCMRRLRLGVPALIGRGLGHDPNSVAEYLDNTLADERVGEFEKICLESDVHLAEVASCHQILTIVLGEPAEIDPEMRHRMYQVAAHVDAPPIQVDSIRATAPVTPPPVQVSTRRGKPEVPDYLRESRWKLWPVAAVVLISALLTCGGLVVFGPPEWRQRVVALFERPPQGAEERSQAEGTKETAGAKPTSEAPENSTTPADDSNPTTAPADQTESAADGAAKPGHPTPLMPPKNTVGADDAGAPPAPEPDEDSGAKGETKATNVPSAPVPAAAAPTEKSRPISAPDSPEPPQAETNPLVDSTQPELPAKPPAADAAADRPEAAAEGFGRYTSKREVLLRFDPRSGDWKRLAAMSPLAKGDRLLSLPLFKPTVSLSTSITIQAEGPALFELVGWSDQEVPIIAVEYGRLLMTTVGKAGNSLQIRLEDAQPQLTFVDAESTLALDVRRILPPGKDPVSGSAPLAVDIYASSGLIRVRNGDAPVDLQAPARKALMLATANQEGDEFPNWVTSEALSDVERLATAGVEPKLLPDRPVGLILKELADDRRREVRSLAIRSACYLGNFEPCVLALNDPQEKTLWTGISAPYIVELRAAVARNPETAGQVRAAFEKQRNADAPALFRLLWGYNTDDLKGGEDAKLVDGLDNSSLDVRVLSFWNLQNITGSTLGYHAGEPTLARRTALKAWKERLRQGKIVLRTASAAGKAKPSGPKAAEKVQP